MYIKRAIEEILDKALGQTKVILLTGARRVGKSTIMQNHFPKFLYITLDNENELIKAKNDRNLFFKNKKFPLIIDEVQYAPEIFRKIKEIVDSQKKYGQVLLTSSQNYELLEKTSESLAGRITILDLYNLSMREINKVKFNKAFIPQEKYFKERKKSYKEYNDIWQNIFRGFAPELYDTDIKRDIEWYYRDYVRTYIERDVRRILNIENELTFRKFLIQIAARTGQILVYNDIAKELGITSVTIKKWCSVLENTGIIKLIYPYQNNILKRMIKAPKVYMLDTGLVCFLTGWSSKETIENGPMSGHIFETFVVNEILKSYINEGKSIDNIFYYRDKEKNEIDLIIQDKDILYPIEIKQMATINLNLSHSFNFLLKNKNLNISKPTIICQVDALEDFDDICFMPVSYI